jgi:hypothetical protein
MTKDSIVAYHLPEHSIGCIVPKLCGIEVCQKKFTSKTLLSVKVTIDVLIIENRMGTKDKISLSVVLLT